MSEPDLLLLDEPTNHLDVAAVEWMEEFLVDRGITLVFVTHDRAFLRRVATRIVDLDRPVKVSEADFSKTVEGSQAPVLVDFYADWCGPCRMVAPFVDEIAQAHVGKLLVAKVDTDKAPGVAMRFGIRSIPTLVVFKGGKEVERSVGFEPQRLQALIEKVVA